MKVRVIIDMEFPDSMSKQQAYSRVKKLDKRLGDFINEPENLDVSFNVEYLREIGWETLDLVRDAL